ncbi:major facilitator superfamily domain-containing protein 6-like [Penaeus monodon]|uniref:major facilitator superfamily domain-containing protein 6-like n=1 Tax=Penaeus monodon TaxID=6687 RepID=UPI0018A78486|nr:major facilitator superfamily domain-containing protein 6-like [Penaeus monodon]
MAPKINKKLLPLKVHYFLKYGGIALLPFLPVVVRQKGVPAQGVGLMWTVTPLASAKAAITFGALADALKIHRAIFLVGLAILGASFTAMFFVPSIPWREMDAPVPSTIELLCKEDTTSLGICPGVGKPENSILPLFLDCDSNDVVNAGVMDEWTSGNCSLQCNLPRSFDGDGDDVGEGTEITVLLGVDPPHQLCNNGTCLMSVEVDLDKYFHKNNNLSCGVTYHGTCRYVCGPKSGEHKDTTLTHLLKTGEFWLMFLCLMLVYGSNSTTTTMADTVCFYMLGQDRHKYGHQRLWGSLAWGIVGMASGALVDLFSMGQPKVNYLPALVIAVTFLTLNVIASTKITFEVPKKEKLTASAMYNTFCSPRMIVFLITVLVLGMTMGIQWTFLLIVVEDVANAWDPTFPYIKLLQGLLVGSDCFLGDVPFLYISSYIIKKLGNILTFLMVLVVFSIRHLLYSAVVNPWYFLPVSLLHGLSFSVFYPNMMSYASSMAPKGVQAMMQGTVKSFFIGGSAIGGFLGGTLIETVGGSKTFLYLGLFLALYTMIFAAVQLLIYKMHPEGPQDGRGEYSVPAVSHIQNEKEDVEAQDDPQELQKTPLYKEDIIKDPFIDN